MSDQNGHRRCAATKNDDTPCRSRHGLRAQVVRYLLVCSAVMGASGMSPGSALASVAIVGGTPVEGFASYWQVTIIAYEAGAPSGLCGGTIVGKRWVLTAAHCVTPAAVGPLTGVEILDEHFSAVLDQVSVADAVKVAPNWNPETGANDWALIRLPQDCYLDADSSGTNNCWGIRLSGIPPPASTVGTALGNGVTSPDGGLSVALLKADLTITPDGFCSLVWGAGFDPQSMLCAIGNGSSATCFGDSGGPLVTIDSLGMPVEVGIVSFGDEFCSTVVPEVYTRVSSALPTILSILTSDPVAPASPPSITLGRARLSKIRENAIAVTYTVRAGGLATDVYLEYGLTTRYGRRTPAHFSSMATVPDAVITEFCNPKPGKTYHVRAVAVNSAGIAYSPDRTVKVPTRKANPAFFSKPCQYLRIPPF